MFIFCFCLQDLERQSKFQRKKTKDEKVDDSVAEEPGGLFDD